MRAAKFETLEDIQLNLLGMIPWRFNFYFQKSDGTGNEYNGNFYCFQTDWEISRETLDPVRKGSFLPNQLWYLKN